MSDGAGAPDHRAADASGRPWYISHAAADQGWAKWISWQLVKAGHEVELACWDWGAGDSVITRTNAALERGRVLALFSPEYFDPARFTTLEWEAIVAMRERITPVRIAEVTPPPVLRPLIAPALFGLNVDDARAVLLRAVNGAVRSSTTPAYPPDEQGRSAGNGGPSADQSWDLPAQDQPPRVPDTPFDTVADTSPDLLEVHAALLPDPDPDPDPAPGSGNTQPPWVTPYLERPHDAELRAALRPALAGEASVLAVLTGESSTGKTRALFEALRELAGDRTLLRPLDGAELVAMLGTRQAAGSVWWLNEAQRFLYHHDAAARLRKLLERPGHIAVATLWTHPHWSDLTRDGVPGDPHGQARALLTGRDARRIVVPSRLSAAEASAWRAMAAEHPSDPRLAHAAAAGAADGKVVQHLAGGPELLAAFRQGPGEHFTRPEHALLTAALDARRIGHQAPMRAELLAQAADAALSPRDRPADTDWHVSAFEALTTGLRSASDGRTDIRRTLTGLIAVRPNTGPAGEVLYDPADYLAQHLRCEAAPHPQLWPALATHTTSAEDLTRLAQQADKHGLTKFAAMLYRAAVGRPGPRPDLAPLASLLHIGRDPDRRGATWAVEHTDYTRIDRCLTLLRALKKVHASEQVREVAARAVKEIGHWDEFPTAALLKELREERLLKLLQIAAVRAAATIQFDNPYQAATLLKELRRANVPEPLRVAAHNAAYETYVVDPRGTALLLEELRNGDARKPLRVAALRAVRGSDLAEPVQAALLINELRQGYEHRLFRTAVLRAVRAIRKTDISHPSDAIRLLNDLREAGVPELAQAVAARIDEVDLAANPHCVTDLLAALHDAGAEKAFQSTAERAYRDIDITLPSSAGTLLTLTHQIGTAEDVTALAARASREADLTDPFGVTSLLDALHQVGATDELHAVAERAVHDTDVTQFECFGAAAVLIVLRDTGAQDALEMLSARAAREVNLTRPFVTCSLLAILRHVGADDHAQTVAERAARETDFTSDTVSGPPLAALLRTMLPPGQFRSHNELADHTPPDLHPGTTPEARRSPANTVGKPSWSTYDTPWTWDDLTV